MTREWAVIPVKGLDESKTRLSTILGGRRRAFVEALLRDVLFAVVMSKVFDKALVVSPDDAVERVANQSDGEFMKQTGSGLNAAVDQANRAASRLGASSVTTILADIPLVQPADFRDVIKIGIGCHRVVMAPSFKGGTNIMLSIPPGVVRPSYGRWSYSRHLRMAQRIGVDAYSISNPRVSFDIDTAEDLALLRDRDPDARTASARLVGQLSHLPKLKPMSLKQSSEHLLVSK